MAEKTVEEKQKTYKTGRAQTDKSVWVLVAKSQLKKVWDDKAKKYTDEVEKRPMKNADGTVKTKKDGTVKNKVTFKVPPFNREVGDLNIFINVPDYNVHEVTQEWNKKALEAHGKKAEDYVAIAFNVTLQGNQQDKSINGYQMINGKPVSIQMKPIDLVDALPKYRVDKDGKPLEEKRKVPMLKTRIAEKAEEKVEEKEVKKEPANLAPEAKPAKKATKGRKA